MQCLDTVVFVRHTSEEKLGQDSLHDIKVSRQTWYQTVNSNSQAMPSLSTCILHSTLKS